VLLVKERSTQEALPVRAAIRAGAAELLNTLRHIRGDRTLLWFLLAYWFYIDGVNTIIKMAVDYGLSLGLKQNSLITALLLVQFIGFPAALAFGWLGQKIGPRAGILLGIAVYTGIAFYAYFLQTEKQFMVMAIIIGLVQGGVQSLSRSLFGRLVPPGKAGEFFGFYNLMGKAAAILGPTLTGVVALTTHDSRLAILSITILFVIGAAFLMRVRLPSNG
jgi:UMF1 family MFS transporter